MCSTCWPACYSIFILLSQEEKTKKKTELYQKALRLCAACPGKELDALKWLEDFEEDKEIHPEVPDYLAALHACEVTRQPLERIWTLLMDMRKKGLELDKSIVDAEHLDFLEHMGVWETLERHCKWLLDSKPHPRTRAAVLRIGGLLKHKGISSAVVRQAVTPLLEALPEQPMKGLGAFTKEALRLRISLKSVLLLRSLGIKSGDETWCGAETRLGLSACKGEEKQHRLCIDTSCGEDGLPGTNQKVRRALC